MLKVTNKKKSLTVVCFYLDCVEGRVNGRNLCGFHVWAGNADTALSEDLSPCSVWGSECSAGLGRQKSGGKRLHIYSSKPIKFPLNSKSSSPVF